MTRRPTMIVCDHDAEDRATIERHLPGYMTKAATKSVADGIQEVAERLRPAGDGKPRLYIKRNARAHPADTYLVEAKFPTCTEEEVPGYVWDTGNGLNPKETPVKAHDHGCDAMRYVANT